MAGFKSSRSGHRTLCCSPKVVPSETAGHIYGVYVKNFIFRFISRMTEALASLRATPAIRLLRPPIYLPCNVTTLQPETVEFVLFLCRLGGIADLFPLGLIPVCIGARIRSIRRLYKMASYNIDVFVGPRAIVLREP